MRENPGDVRSETKALVHTRPDISVVEQEKAAESVIDNGSHQKHNVSQDEKFRSNLTVGREPQDMRMPGGIEWTPSRCLGIGASHHWQQSSQVVYYAVTSSGQPHSTQTPSLTVQNQVTLPQQHYCGVPAVDEKSVQASICAMPRNQAPEMFPSIATTTPQYVMVSRNIPQSHHPLPRYMPHSMASTASVFNQIVVPVDHPYRTIHFPPIQYGPASWSPGSRSVHMQRFDFVPTVSQAVEDTRPVHIISQTDGACSRQESCRPTIESASSAYPIPVTKSFSRNQEDYDGLLYQGVYGSTCPMDRVRVWLDSKNSGELLYDCVCGKRSPNPSLQKVKRHVYRHQVDVYTCDVCNKKFDHHWSLNAHKRIHRLQ